MQDEHRHSPVSWRNQGEKAMRQDCFINKQYIALIERSQLIYGSFYPSIMQDWDFYISSFPML